VKASERLAYWARPLFFLAHNPVTLLGAILTTSTGLTMVGFWALEVLQLRPTHAYAGIILFLVLPGLFVAGLVLMPAGIVWRRRKLVAAGGLPEAFPPIDLGSSTVRRGLTLVAVATLLNIALLSTASYKAVEHMDSVQFCGTTCHTVMAPEYTAYLNSPHSRVACVECHIGSGASWFVRSKLSGTRQVFAVALGTYSRPIPSPVKHLRPARETCEQCHWPEKFHGDKLLVRTKYGNDEKNSPSTTVLVLKVGGRSWQKGVGIHGRHLSSGARISYVTTDARRQVIPRVTVVDDAGKSVEYVSTEVKPSAEELARGERRTMDCMDCHNRPSHSMEMPERAVDQALAEGRISPELPFVKKQAVELLRAEYADRDTAAQKIASGLVEFYKSGHPETYAKHRAVVETAADQVVAIYRRNVFPAMKVGWGSYPNNIGHEDFLGCFRCHDENHKSADGRTLTQSCDACHSVLAMDEANPKVLDELSLR
jgi:nitrate/TMAO reductase-like tetraheme cytochrome c subunit